MNRLNLNRLLLIAALGAAAATSACDEPPAEAQTVEVQVQDTTAPAAEESAAPAVAEAPAADAPPPVDALPAEQRTSAQTVQPESDTLFY
ncbi:MULTISPECIES: hypothetical protein [unclassified Brevundimonas]|uniref:hypothetical protein n=1 Tax=unclassified Brevundimonas TaxID=2622653 RepID=UPI003F9035E8